MSDQSSFPEYPPVAPLALTPMFAVRDPKASIAWFEKLGFTSLGAATTPDGTIMHAELVRGPSRIMIGPAQGEVGAPGLELYMRLDDGIGGFYSSVRAAGVTIVEHLRDQFWGDRTFTVMHPDGYRIMFAQTIRDVSMEEIQEYLAQPSPATA